MSAVDKYQMKDLRIRDCVPHLGLVSHTLYNCQLKHTHILTSYRQWRHQVNGICRTKAMEYWNQRSDRRARGFKAAVALCE